VRRRLSRPGSVMIVASLALLVALSGVATAAGVVPLAKRALVADNAKKLGGRTLPQLTAATATAIKVGAKLPSPASTASALVAVKSQAAGQIGPGEYRELGSLACDSGQKVMGGGISSDGIVGTFDSYPANDTTWAFAAANFGDSTANVTLWVTCLE
jgi:hypothetical protein